MAPQYLVAFWGVETNYGSFMGDFSALRSVATLACMTKRTAFFANETIQALKILANNHMTTQQMKGSWAGAMGNMQFMPSTFTKWAVDRDGNGRIDIWNSMPDAFASAANFLRGIGFKPGLPAAEEVVPAAELPARPGRHHGREAGARLGGDGREARRRRAPCRQATSRRRSSCRPAGAGPPSSSIRTSRR